MKKRRLFPVCLTFFALCLVGRGAKKAAAVDTAAVFVNFDLGGGGSGFAAILYAQEVTSRETFRGHYSSGSHGLVTLPTSSPVAINVTAPGTYVFYAVLVETPEDYHYGATGCKPATDCPSSDLIALDVNPGRTYAITISDRHARLPAPGAPVSVQWKR